MSSLRLWIGATIVVFAYALGIGIQAAYAEQSIILTRGALRAVTTDDPALAAKLDTPATMMLDRMGKPLPGLERVTPTRAYKNVNQFRRDLVSGDLPPAIKAVVYDPEQWKLTPLLQQQHPYRYMRKFVVLAKRHGLRSVLAPAKDLIRAMTSCPRVAGVMPRARYIQCGLARLAGTAYVRTRIAGSFLVPTQADAGVPSLFGSFYQRGAVQARLAHKAVHVLAGLSTGLHKGSYTAGQLVAAARNAGPVDGYWLGLNQNDPQAVTAMTGFLEAAL